MVKHRKSNNEKEKSDSKLDNQVEKNSNNLISLIIFSLGFIVVLLSSVSIVFPGLVISIVDVNPFGESFEIGAMGIPFIIVNVIVFSLIFLYLKQRLPGIFFSISEKIFSFDLSKKNSLIFLIIILAIYVASSANELTIYELNQYGDFLIVKDALEIWPDGKSDNVYVTEQLTRHVRMILLVASDEIFDNIKIIPYIGTILLLVTTYFLTFTTSHLVSKLYHD